MLCSRMSTSSYLVWSVIVLVTLSCSLQQVDAGEYCYDTSSGSTTYCSGLGAYCCYGFGDSCCYNTWYSFWWIWFIIVMLLISLSACCGYYRRRRIVLARRQVIVTQPAYGAPYVQPVYGAAVTSTVTTAGQYGYSAPVAPPGYSNPNYLGAAHQTPSYAYSTQPQGQKNAAAAPPPAYSSLQSDQAAPSGPTAPS